MSPFFRFLVLSACGVLSAQSALGAQLRIATFDVDATPPTGSQLMYDPFKAVGELGLRSRGVVITGVGEPVVLCSVDWIGIANAGHDEFRDALAAAAGTTRSRVSVHVIHQHDAVVFDTDTERVLKQRHLPPGAYDAAWGRPTIARTAAALASAMTNTLPFNQVGWGRAEVKQVASNRRIPGPDGKIKVVRYTATVDPALRAEPEGVIDPYVTLVSFWDNSRPIAVLSYYACHPQSYYRTGIANPDFPGIARFLRDQALPGVRHIHFNGAGGNLGAGKYNDGAVTNRAVLAGRLADGMARAWEVTRRTNVRAEDMKWTVEPVLIPVGPQLDRDKIEARLKTPALYTVAPMLAWMDRRQAGTPIEVSCLQLGNTRILNLPGELFVEYQLSAQKLRPDVNVAMASYADYGPAYIGTAVAYTEGGYETSADATYVGRGSEAILMDAIRKLLSIQ
ncbi:MAG: hypothetical protein EXS36_14345 [Pedosphaera sp.]|nr:hypothetical protein [Pedosphaera sp.]